MLICEFHNCDKLCDILNCGNLWSWLYSKLYVDDFDNYCYIFDDAFWEEMMNDLVYVKAYIMQILIDKIIAKCKLLCEKQIELTLIKKLTIFGWCWDFHQIYKEYLVGVYYKKGETKIGNL